MKSFFLLLAALVLCSNSCKRPSFGDRFYDLTIVNNSTDTVRVLLLDGIENLSSDTGLPILRPSLRKIDPDKSGYFYSKNSWADILKILPENTLSVFFIQNHVYENGDWDSIRLNYNIIKRLDLNIEDLESANYVIPYH